MKIQWGSGPNRVFHPGQTDCPSVVNRLIRLMQRIPHGPRIECKDAVAWMIRKWPLKKDAPIFSYTGGFFEDKRIENKFLYHTVAVVKTGEAYFIADPTYSQFKPAKDCPVFQTAPDEGALLETLQQIYGGKWYQL